MKRVTLRRIIGATFCLILLQGLTSAAADTKAAAAPAKKLTCCQEAKAKKKACAHNCCVTAHRKNESCTKCNPNKEDLEKPATPAKKPEAK